ncbi:MAG: DUF2062 domain-containing protein [Opitutales bacterium]|nr:DUF2062 domain-containing protein [Opitutales bacterium]
MSRIADWFKRKVKDPLLAELKQGITAKELALACAASLAISVNPFIGTTTLLCLLAGKVFRLNHVVMQIINYFSYPLQIVLIIPWIRLGEKLTGAEAQVIEITQMKAVFSQSFVDFVTKFCQMGVHAFLGWLVVVPAATWILYKILVLIFKRFITR